ncbi:MAG TPA: type IV secretory system conjugative DNA transfer family protein [Solirubrobacterales bacterium]|nr:type IV secretory system conjugative DNA transfer family protein [Solirubrobacterales bacterium]
MSGDRERVVGLALVAVATTVMALVWITGAFAGVIFSGAPATTTAAVTIEVALHLPAHLGDPRLAWPPTTRQGLPGPVGMYGVMAVELAGLAAAVSAVVPRLRGMELPSLGGGRGKPPVTEWARRRDLAPLIVDGPKPGRITLGRRGRDLLAAEEGQSVIVFGPTQSGKTSGLVIPALLEWEGPVVCTSVKSDLLAPTLERREELGETWVFDPTQSVDVERARATPLHSADTWEGALQTAHRIASSAKGAAGDLSDGSFWFANGEKLLAPLMLAANLAGGTMETVVTWVDEGPEACKGSVVPILERSNEEAATRAFLATHNREERARSSVYTTAETMIAAYADPRVAEETAGSDYTPERLLDGGANTLFLISPRSEQQRLQAVHSSLIEGLIAVAEEMSIKTGRPILPRLLLALDEFANTAPFPRADEVAATGSGLGIQQITVLQDLSQLKARLGNRSASMVNNHRAKIVVGGIADLDTTDYFSRLAGVAEFAHNSTSTGRGKGGDSRTEGDTYRELAPQHLLRELESGRAVLAYGNRSAAMITLRPWFEAPAR